MFGLIAAAVAATASAVGAGIKAGQAAKQRREARRARKREAQRAIEAQRQQEQQYLAQQNKMKAQYSDQALNTQMAIANSGGTAASQAAGQNQAMMMAPMTQVQAGIGADQSAQGYAGMLGNTALGQGTLSNQNAANENQINATYNQQMGAAQEQAYGAIGGGLSVMGSMLSDERTKQFNRGVGSKWAPPGMITSDERVKRAEDELAAAQAAYQQKVASGQAQQAPAQQAQPTAGGTAPTQATAATGQPPQGQQQTPSGPTMTSSQRDLFGNWAGVPQESRGPAAGAQPVTTAPYADTLGYDKLMDARRTIANEQGAYSSKIRSVGGFKRGTGYSQAGPKGQGSGNVDLSGGMRQRTGYYDAALNEPNPYEGGYDPNESKAARKARIAQEVKQAANVSTMAEAEAYRKNLLGEQPKAAKGKGKRGAAPQAKQDAAPVRLQDLPYEALPPEGSRENPIDLDRPVAPVRMGDLPYTEIPKGSPDNPIDLDPGSPDNPIDLDQVPRQGTTMVKPRPPRAGRLNAKESAEYRKKLAAWNAANAKPSRPGATRKGDRARSDEESKIARSGSESEAAEVFRETPGYAFSYKPEYQDGPGADDKPHYGIMAQDLEKSPAGATVVEEDERGMKQVDTGRLTMLNSAAIHDLLARLDEVEGKKGKKRRKVGSRADY